MTKIVDVRGKEILDSRGNPTVYARVILDNGGVGLSSVPSGASTGTREAVELRDGKLDKNDPHFNKSRYGGKGVLKAVHHVNNELRNAVVGMDVEDQAGIDNIMVEMDGTENKGKFGANALLAVSLAVLRASAFGLGDEVFRRVSRLCGNQNANELPVPMLNILNGGAHAAGSTDFQEFMVVPVGMTTFSDALRAGSEIYHKLGETLEEQGQSTNVGFEGGYAPHGLTNRQALSFVTQAIEDAGYVPGEEIFIALDPAASEFYKNPTERPGAGRYNLRREGYRFPTERMINEYAALRDDYPIYSIEDGLAEDDWEGWSTITSRMGSTTQLVGDDLFVTQERYLRRGIKEAAGNAILIKLNQVGTVTETLATIKMAQDAGFGVVISHRSGETEDTTIADLAVGTSAGQIKTGAPARSERVAKYNRLLRIEETLGDSARYAGTRVLDRAAKKRSKSA
jgi:enolase